MDVPEPELPLAATPWWVRVLDGVALALLALIAWKTLSAETRAGVFDLLPRTPFAVPLLCAGRRARRPSYPAAATDIRRPRPIGLAAYCRRADVGARGARVRQHAPHGVRRGLFRRRHVWPEQARVRAVGAAALQPAGAFRCRLLRQHRGRRLRSRPRLRSTAEHRILPGDADPDAHAGADCSAQPRLACRASIAWRECSGPASLVSLASFLFALYYLMKLATLLMDEERARHAVILIATYPFACFYNAPYTESCCCSARSPPVTTSFADNLRERRHGDSWSA